MVQGDTMAQATFHFPRGFLWGTATAAYQVEGNNPNSNWWAWEQQPGKIANGYKSGLACDWWNGRWRDDFQRAAEGAQNAHRMSIEWSRIQPTPDRWDDAALNRYVEMVRGLSELNITPLITLHHYSDPQWFVENGGWENDSAAEYFEKYVRRVVQALKDYVSLWCTFNEPNGYATLGFIQGIFPPGKKDFNLGFKVMVNMVRAHAAAYHAIHQIQPQAWVGMAHYYRSLVPSKSWSPLDRLSIRLLMGLNEVFASAANDGVVKFIHMRKQVREAKATQDYLGIDYYTRDYVSFNLLHYNELFGRRYFREGADLSSTGFLANEPLGMYEALKWGLKFNLPIIITENGFDDSDDRVRPRFIIEHLHQVWRAVNFNWPIKGYFHWTLVDNFEWERGWTQRFGLWELDVDTQARHKRPSANLYAEICRENGISDDMAKRYAPEVLAELFPD
jgi:beta-glucosidase